MRSARSTDGGRHPAGRPAVREDRLGKRFQRKGWPKKKNEMKEKEMEKETEKEKKKKNKLWRPRVAASDR